MAILNHLNGDDSNHPLEKNGTCTRRWTHHRKRLKVGSLWASFRRRDGWIVDFLLGSILLVLLIIHTLDIIFCILCIYLSYIDLIYIYTYDIYIYTSICLMSPAWSSCSGSPNEQPCNVLDPFFRKAAVEKGNTVLDSIENLLMEIGEGGSRAGNSPRNGDLNGNINEHR